ncbi:hypothetical protein tb265_47720 [Gemmatimonadetes bacterium T265]|nr:hypothetical protein tb265_47720 [Gemmatimonadetes bacterium T265]
MRLAAVLAQRWAAAALGVSWGRRTDTVTAMLEDNARRAPSYWIQLTLAMGIATLGLVLNSTAVVIGAMLVSPLMGPIVELGMGFAVGSPLLTLRAAVRVLQSVIAVVGGAAVFTLALPFHDVTAEIAGRTAPTALDLLVAVCCALTAAYTTVRAAADTTAAAAGTAIGIALVPPLCVIGYGLGTGAHDIAAGAALLFTANFSAIVVFSVLVFLLLGYNGVNAPHLEANLRATPGAHRAPITDWALRVPGALFGSRYGLVIRLGVPALFLAVVAVPLARALDEVAWEVRARTAIRQLVAADAPEAVQTSVTVADHAVTLRLVVLASSAQAAQLERRLQASIARKVGGATPDVTVTAVAGAADLAAVLRDERAHRRAPAPPPSPPTPPPAATFRDRVGAVLTARWPTTVVGPLVSWDAAVLAAAADSSAAVRPTTPAAASAVRSADAPAPTPTPVDVTVRYVGAPLGAPATAMLASALTEALGAATRVTVASVPPGPIVAPPRRPTRWLATVSPVLAAVASTPGAWACVDEPARPTARAVRRAITGSTVAGLGRLRVTRGPHWALRVALGGCTTTK